jgi:DNA-binding MarR family transcriptional regulator
MTRSEEIVSILKNYGPMTLYALEQHMHRDVSTALLTKDLDKMWQRGLVKTEMVEHNRSGTGQWKKLWSVE